MPTIKLTDSFGFVGDIQFPEDANILKYIRDLRQITAPGLNLKALQQVPLDAVPLKSASGGLSFQQPLSIGIDQVEMKIKAGTSGQLRLSGPKDEQLFDPELFGEPISIGPNQFYLSFGITASLATALQHKADLSFGFEAGSEIVLAVHKPFTKPDGGSFPSFVTAVTDTTKAFVIIGNIDDLASMSKGVVATVEGRGSLKFSGNAELLTVVNPLVSVDLPAPAGELKVVSAGSINVGASFELFGSYQIRAQKIEEKVIRLGFYKKRGSEFGLKVSAKSGVSAGVGEFDFLGQLLKAVSKDPAVDKKQLADAGLSKDQIAAIEAVVKGGIQRNLELALSMELIATQSHEAAFAYEIDLTKLGSDGRQAIHAALRGDLSALTQNEDHLPAGVVLKRSIFTETKKKKHTIKVNLLGILNFISVSSLILKGRVMHVPETGEIVITDSATATRIAASTSNFAADSAKLRRVMAESFLITAAYRSSQLLKGSPDLSIVHSYFELNANTKQSGMKDNLDVVETLGLMTQQEKDKLIAGINNFGNCTFYVEAKYDDDLATKLFLNADGTPRQTEEYEQIGREAIKSLVEENESDDYRRLPATDDALWEELSEIGTPQPFKFVDKIKALAASKHLPIETLVGGIGSDYLVIKWWADEMSDLGEKLSEVRNFLKDNPHIDPEDDEFNELRRSLAEHLKGVAKRTKSQFGDPWGLIAMDLATGKRAKAKAQVTGPRFAFVRERP